MNEFAKNIKNAIQKVEPNAEVILFGSRARGDFRSDSDWDVLVISPEIKITLEYEYKLYTPILELELETGQVISLLIYSSFDPV